MEKVKNYKCQFCFFKHEDVLKLHVHIQMTHNPFKSNMILEGHCPICKTSIWNCPAHVKNVHPDFCPYCCKNFFENPYIDSRPLCNCPYLVKKAILQLPLKKMCFVKK